MGVKKSKFPGSNTIDDSATLDFVINGQNLKILKSDFLAALGVTGTISQAGPVAATPVLDVSGGTDNKIRNLENGSGAKASISPENGITLAHNFISGSTGQPVFDNTTDIQPLFRSLLAGSNFSIVKEGDHLILSAAIGAVANTVIVQQKSDFPAAIGGVIQLETAAYTIVDKIDLVTDVLAMGEGTLIRGYTAEISQITTNSSSPLISAIDLAFEAVAIKGGLELNNSGAGAIVRVEGTSICFMEQLLSLDSGGTVLEVHNNTGGIAIDKWTCVNGVDGIVMTGTGNTGPIIESFNPVGLTGKGIDIQGDISSGALRIRGALINTDGNAVDISGSVQGVSFSGDAVSTSGNGMNISGTLAGGMLLESTNILSSTLDGMDITGSTIASIIGEAAGITSTAASKSGLKGDAGSANITNAAIFSSSSIQGLGAGGTPLSGITKKDIKYSFTNAGADIVDSANIGVFTLDAQATTTLSFQGADGTITAFADSAGNPGVDTTVSTAATPASGAPVAIFGTTSYNGLFTAANVVGGVSFDIVRTFVADDATGTWESGWVKINGNTTDGETIERFTSGANNNEIESLDTKTIAVTYSATITGEKIGGTAESYRFSLFCDDQGGSGFVKINGSIGSDFTSRQATVPLRIPTEAPSGAKFTAFVRNIDAATDFECDALTVDIGAS